MFDLNFDEKSSLLFCDTFKHGEREVFQEYRLDMVGFSQVVSVSEVRVIPDNCKVHPKINDRLGATRPKSFSLELFVKDLGRPNAVVFEKLGVLDYEEGKSIQFVASTKIATNVLLLKGWYQNLTICVYGNVVGPKLDGHPSMQGAPGSIEVNKNIGIPFDPMLLSHQGMRHPVQGASASIPHVVQASTGALHPSLGPVFIQAQPVAALPPHIDQVGFNRGNFPPQSPRDEERYHDCDDYHRGRGHDYRHNDRDDERDSQFRRYPQDSSSRFEEERRMYANQQNDYYGRDNQDQRNQGRRPRENNQKDQPSIPTEELFEPLSPEPEFGDDSQETKKTPKQTNEEIGYEDIESDEDMLEDFDFDDVNLQGDFEADETWDSLVLNFNPYQSTLTSIEAFNNITETSFERKVRSLKASSDIEEPTELKQLQNNIVSDSEADRDVRWVLMLEELPNIFPPSMAYLRSQVSQKIKEKHFVSIISEWAAYGLNMDNIRVQPLAVNMRFLKASLKLTHLLASSSGEYLRLLVEGGVQKKLVDLLKMEHVASSIKLLVVKALDATVDSAFGLENLLHWNGQNEDESSSYEELVKFLLSNPTIRVVMAIKSVLEKVSFYEALATMQSICSKISESPSKEVTANELKDEENEPMEEGDAPPKVLKKAVDLNISMKDVNDLHSSLHHIYKMLQAPDKMSQPSPVTFPTSSKMKSNSKESNYPVIMRLLQSRRFLESLTMIVTSPLFCEPIIYALVRDILFLLMDTEEGLLFLSLDITTTNNLIRALLQVPCESDVDFMYMLSLTQFTSNEESLENCYPHHIGLMLIYHLQALQYIYQLQKTSKTDSALAEMDSSENISTLHSLYAMTFSPVGCDAVVNVLAKSDHVNSILPFLSGNEEFSGKLKKSVSSRYAAVLLNLTLRHSNNIELYRKFAAKLLTIPKQDHDTVYDEIHSYLLPFEKINSLDVEAIPLLLETIKSEAEDFKFGSPLLNGVLVALRLLKHLVKPGHKVKDGKDLQQNLAIIQLISSDGFNTLLQLYGKITHHLESNIKQNNPIVSSQCSLLLHMLPLLLELSDTFLTQLLSTTYCFKDSRLVQCLLKLHALLCSKPINSFMETTLSQIQDGIVNLLIKFLKGTASTPDSEEAIKSSTSYILFQEVLTFIVQKPENFVSGLMLLSEFLPTPLPIYTFYEMKDNDIKKVMGDHMLAMANISFLGEELQLVLQTVIASASSNLQYYLRRVACQLVDLSASISTMIVKSLLQLISSDLSNSPQESEESTAGDNSQEKETNNTKKRSISNVAMNAFSLLSYLVCQPAGKITLLNILSVQEDGTSQFPDFIDKLITLAENEQSSRYMNGSLLPFFQSLCDHEICMENFDGVIHLLHLSNSLPDESLLCKIVEMLFSLLSKKTVAIPIIIRSLNILESLTDHDYGMQVISKCLVEKGDCIEIFLNKMIEEVKSKSEAQLVYAAISTFIEFISLTNSSGPENYMKPYLYDEEMKSEEDEKGESGNTKNEESEDNRDESIENTKPLQRKVFIDGNVLKKIFKLDEKNSNTHPLTELEKLIEEDSKMDEELVSVSQAITTLRMIMIASTTSNDQDKKDVPEMKLLPVDSTQVQFGQRLTSVLMNSVEDERASSNDWFDELPPEEIDPDSDSETVKVNLMEMCEKYFPNFNLKEEMDKGVVDISMVKKSKRLKHGAFFRAGDHIEDTKRLRFDASALSTPPSMRGIGRGANRGVTRGYMNRGTGRGGRGFRGFSRGRGRGRGGQMDLDGFRQRRQNTSRPPSMHVDDFVSMEKKGDTLMSHPKNQGNDSSSANDRHDNSANFNSPSNNQRWNYPHFRRNTDDNQQSGDRGNYNTYSHSRTYYNSGNKFHNRSSSDWNNSNYRPRGHRDSYGRRGNNMGGYWNKNRDDNRYSGGSDGGYRQGNRMNYRHNRTFTR